MKRTSERLAAIAPSATLAVDSKAKALKASGENVIGFGAGEPDFPTPAHIVDAAVEACRDPKNHRYSPAGGLPELKEAIAAKTLRDSGYQVDASQVLVTNGGKHAVYTAFAALCDPGDEVIVPGPVLDHLSGGDHARRRSPDRGRTPPTRRTSRSRSISSTAARTERTKVLLFVSPDNPSGAVYSPAEVRAIGEWAVEHGIWVITDEIYEHLVYGSHEFASMPTLVPDLAEQCLVVNGVAKTYAMTGWRVGWMIGPNDVDQGLVELPEPCHLERLQRGAESGDRGGVGSARRCRDDARRVRPPRCDDAPACSTTSTASPASNRRVRSTASRT